MKSWSCILVVTALFNYVVGVISADEATLFKTALMRACWNAKYDPTPNRLADWTSGNPSSRLYLEDIWWSARSSNTPLTIVTVTSLDRLHMLEAQCSGYSGPLAVAVYVPLTRDDSLNPGGGNQTDAAGVSGGDAWRGTAGVSGGARRLRAANAAARGPSGGRRLQQAAAQDTLLARTRAKLQDLFHRMEEQGAATAAAAGPDGDGDAALGSGCCCQLRLMLFSERLADPALAVLVPTNALRNAAMLASDTPLTAMLDVDLGASASLNSLVRNESWVQAVLREVNASQPTMCIAPTWQAAANLTRDRQALAVRAALTGSKDSVVWMWRQALLQVFAAEVCPQCQGAIEHDKWTAVDAPYQAQYSQGFAPWGIMMRRRDPGHDERFRGWLYHKQTYVEALIERHGFRLMVLPELWLVHRLHRKVSLAQLPNSNATSASIGSRNGGRMLASSKDMPALLQEVLLNNGTSTTVFKMYRSYVDSLRDSIRATLALRKAAPVPYEPQLGSQFLYCKSVLPWWQA